MDYISTSRSNYFRVKDAEAFKAWCSIFHAVAWPSDYMDDDDTLVEVDFTTELAQHLMDTDIAVLMEAGAEGQRYVAAHAFAVNSDGASVSVNIDEIYAKAKTAFGTDKCITEAVR